MCKRGVVRGEEDPIVVFHVTRVHASYDVVSTAPPTVSGQAGRRRAILIFRALTACETAARLRARAGPDRPAAAPHNSKVVAEKQKNRTRVHVHVHAILSFWPPSRTAVRSTRDAAEPSPPPPPPPTHPSFYPHTGDRVDRFRVVFRVLITRHRNRGVCLSGGIIPPVEQHPTAAETATVP